MWWQTGHRRTTNVFIVYYIKYICLKPYRPKILAYIYIYSILRIILGTHGYLPIWRERVRWRKSPKPLRSQRNNVGGKYPWQLWICACSVRETTSECEYNVRTISREGSRPGGERRVALGGVRSELTIPCKYIIIFERPIINIITMKQRLSPESFFGSNFCKK